MIRYESKYQFSRLQFPKIVNYINFNFEPDKEFPSDLVSSIYFDTFDRKCAQQTYDGEQYRAKVRYRFYNKDFETGYLEVKTKNSSLSDKVRKLCTFSDIINSSIIDIIGLDLKYIPNFDLNLLGKMVPICQVNYNRSRFISRFSGIRISIDSNINSHLLTSYGATPEPLNYALIQDSVLEVKRAPEDRLAIREEYLIASKLILRKSAFSKYGCSISQLLGG